MLQIRFESDMLHMHVHNGHLGSLSKAREIKSDALSVVSKRLAWVTKHALLLKSIARLRSRSATPQKKGLQKDGMSIMTKKSVWECRAWLGHTKLALFLVFLKSRH
jgi:hypothetical protein